MDLLPEFTRTLSVLGVRQPGDARPEKVVVGVSGGVDSLALLHLFVRAWQSLAVAPIVVHVNHLIRGAEADADARFVAGIAEEWGVPCHVERIDVPALAAERKLSLEEAARQARYTLLGQHAARLGARLIAVAHNADDQAETVLMHLLRGAGLAGLRGMLPVAPLSDYHLLEPVDASLSLIRPLLGVPRAAIEAYSTAHGLQPRFDRSNLDTTYFRNRLRHVVMPVLEGVNPNVKAVLARTASVLAADYDVLQAEVEAAWQVVIREESGERVCFDRAGWRALPLALRRATLRRAAWHLRAHLRDVSFRHVEDAAEVALQGETGARATLPGGLALRVDYDTLVIEPEGKRPPAPDWPFLEPGTVVTVPGEGEVMLPGSGWVFSLHAYEGPRSGPAWQALLTDPWSAPLDAGQMAAPLALRPRLPGDRFAPMGAGGSQKVSDFMINAKIPAAWRDHLPLLVSGEAIVWLCGWRVDARFAVRDDSGPVWLARFTPG